MWSWCSVTCSSRRARFVVMTLAALSLSLVAGTVAADACWLPPVDAPVVDPFRPPPCAWCPGNRGLEYGTPAGTVVRAVAAGEVTFSGTVAGMRYVVVRHADGRRATYGGLASSPLHAGDVVAARQRRRDDRRPSPLRPPRGRRVRRPRTAARAPRRTAPARARRRHGRPSRARRRACGADDGVRARIAATLVRRADRTPPDGVTLQPRCVRPGAQSYPRHIHLLVLRSPTGASGRCRQPQRRFRWPSSRCVRCSRPVSTSGTRPAGGTPR